MKTYTLYFAGFGQTIPNAVYYTNEQGQMVSFLFDPANTDYANFKREINEGTAQLQDADGNLMTAEQARDLVKELP